MRKPIRRVPVGTVWRLETDYQDGDDTHDRLVIGHGDEAESEGVIVVCACTGSKWRPAPITDGFMTTWFRANYRRVS
jgi:hypothetical protein